jgi:6-phosphogluconolactonase
MTQLASVEVHPTQQELMVGAADSFVAIADAAIGASGRFTVALSGGGTPRRLYALLATESYARRIDWSRTHVFWSDERCVPPDHVDSNYRTACETLLDRVPIPPENVHRMRGDAEPVAAAASYEQELRDTFHVSHGEPRLERGARFDLVLLGLGANGHTASLFPHMPAVRERARWVSAEHVSELAMWRLTLTPPVINAAAEVIFLVSGAEKADVLERVLHGPRQPDLLPAQAIEPRAGRLRWLVDASAAARLSGR